jgi:hypothetical protein
VLKNPVDWSNHTVPAPGLAEVVDVWSVADAPGKKLAGPAEYVPLKLESPPRVAFSPPTLFWATNKSFL